MLQSKHELIEPNNISYKSSTVSRRSKILTISSSSSLVIVPLTSILFSSPTPTPSHFLESSISTLSKSSPLPPEYIAKLSIGAIDTVVSAQLPHVFKHLSQPSCCKGSIS